MPSITSSILLFIFVHKSLVAQQSILSQATPSIQSAISIGPSSTLLVEIHNGYIELESKEGNGSIFRVYLPNENDNSMIKVKSCNEYNVNIERVYAELSDIYELI